jgi:hypothetical protein
MLDFLGRSAAIISLADIPNQSDFGLYDDYGVGSTVEVYVAFSPNGIWYARSTNSYGNWYSPTTAGIGAYYWIRFTLTAYSQNQGTYASPSTGWMNLASYGDGIAQPYLNASTAFGGSTLAVWTIEISTDSYGGNIVATRSNYTMQITIA